MLFGRSLLWVFLIGVSLTAVAPGFCEEAGVSPRLREALQELRASASFWRDIDAKIRASRIAGKLPEDEIDQYAEFVAELKKKVLEECGTVRELGGERFLDRFDCRLPEQATRPLAALPSRP